MVLVCEELKFVGINFIFIIVDVLFLFDVVVEKFGGDFFVRVRDVYFEFLR